MAAEWPLVRGGPSDGRVGVNEIWLLNRRQLARARASGLPGWMTSGHNIAYRWGGRSQTAALHWALSDHRVAASVGGAAQMAAQEQTRCRYYVTGCVGGAAQTAALNEATSGHVIASC